MYDDGRYRLQPQEDDEIQNEQTYGSHGSVAKSGRHFFNKSILSFTFPDQELKSKISACC